MNYDHTENWKKTLDRIQILYSNEKYVSDALVNEWKQWDQYSAVFISAPTGSGKNTFIEQRLRDWRKSNILIVGNRIALNRQTKENIAREIRKYDAKRIDGILEQINNASSSTALDDTTDFGHVSICSYQSVCNKKILNRDDFDYIIFDECHFFLADSMFNKDTSKIWNEIIKSPAFTKAKTRIFMSATLPNSLMHLCNDIPIKDSNILIPSNNSKLINIYAAAKSYSPPPPPPSQDGLPVIHVTSVPKINVKSDILIYEFEPDYDYVDFFYFNAQKEIEDKIFKSNNNDKWLIFVPSISKGETLQARLGPDQAEFIDSSSKDSPKYLKLLKTNRFDKKILISTSVIDNGVNIDMSDLKNIVIFSSDREQFIQMLGRRRRQNSTERITLYLKTTSLSEFYNNSSEAAAVLRQLDVLETYNNNKEDYTKLSSSYQNNTKNSDSLLKKKIIEGRTEQLSVLEKVFKQSDLFYLEKSINKFDTLDHIDLVWNHFAHIKLCQKVEYLEQLIELIDKPLNHNFYIRKNCTSPYSTFLKNCKKEKIIELQENNNPKFNNYKDTYEKMLLRTQITQDIFKNQLLSTEDISIIEQLSWLNQEHKFDIKNYLHAMTKEVVIPEVQKYLDTISTTEFLTKDSCKTPYLWKNKTIILQLESTPDHTTSLITVIDKINFINTLEEFSKKLDPTKNFQKNFSNLNSFLKTFESEDIKYTLEKIDSVSKEDFLCNTLEIPLHCLPTTASPTIWYIKKSLK